eukprot:CAMPEP_0181371816 /NCGR_PEP_ID=MMETSP1106-20121128/14335_1 /TAXON_ID=81844 /ORGANISM="Mantoniella antarctica, Strain SL-175" /LENGTH=129 /DNA_ID=CAMNT_0023489049 /DNA_START=199 /DNA_END=586 /DNA_ORIENTATION=-
MTTSIDTNYYDYQHLLCAVLRDAITSTVGRAQAITHGRLTPASVDVSPPHHSSLTPAVFRLSCSSGLAAIMCAGFPLPPRAPCLHTLLYRYLPDSPSTANNPHAFHDIVVLVLALPLPSAPPSADPDDD